MQERRARAVRAALDGARHGDSSALAALYNEVYEELHRLASLQRRRWSGNHTLDTTALVHESYLKLTRRAQHTWADLRHFYATASRAMRQLLLNYAEGANARKRGGDLRRVELGDHPAAGPVDVTTLLSVSDALERLRHVDERRATVFEYRFFLGLAVDEVCGVLEISPATAKRDWTLAIAWLRMHIDRP